MLAMNKEVNFESCTIVGGNCDQTNTIVTIFKTSSIRSKAVMAERWDRTLRQVMSSGQCEQDYAYTGVTRDASESHFNQFVPCPGSNGSNFLLVPTFLAADGQSFFWPDFSQIWAMVPPLMDGFIHSSNMSLAPWMN